MEKLGGLTGKTSEESAKPGTEEKEQTKKSQRQRKGSVTSATRKRNVATSTRALRKRNVATNVTTLGRQIETSKRKGIFSSLSDYAKKGWNWFTGLFKGKHDTKAVEEATKGITKTRRLKLKGRLGVLSGVLSGVATIAGKGLDWAKGLFKGKGKTKGKQTTETIEKATKPTTLEKPKRSLLGSIVDSAKSTAKKTWNWITGLFKGKRGVETAEKVAKDVEKASHGLKLKGRLGFLVGAATTIGTLLGLIGANQVSAEEISPSEAHKLMQQTQEQTPTYSDEDSYAYAVGDVVVAGLQTTLGYKDLKESLKTIRQQGLKTALKSGIKEFTDTGALGLAKRGASTFKEKGLSGLLKGAAKGLTKLELKGIAKGLVKYGLRKLPVIGTVIDLMSAYQRFKEGDVILVWLH